MRTPLVAVGDVLVVTHALEGCIKAGAIRISRGEDRDKKSVIVQ